MSELTAIKERPILFSGEMVRAILDGRKTQTRRVVKRQPPQHYDYRGVDEDGPYWMNGYAMWRPNTCPYGKPRDRLWVRETWAPAEPGPLKPEMPIAYRADYLNDPHGADGENAPEGPYRKWKPSIHMPRWASRITLDITNVRVERLQEISPEDAIAEGGSRDTRPHDPLWDSVALQEFHLLWESINGKDSWNANPWVWVIEFKPVTSVPQW